MKRIVALLITFVFLFSTTMNVDAVPATSTKMHVTQDLRNSIDSIYMVLTNGDIVLMEGSGSGSGSKHYTTADGGGYNHSLIDYFVVNGLKAEYGVHYTWVNQDGEPDSEYEANGTGNYLLESMPTAPLLSVEKTAVEGDGSSVEKTEWETGETIWFKVTVSNPENFDFSTLKYTDIKTGADEVELNMVDTSVSTYDFWISLSEDESGDYINEVVIDGYVEVISGDDQSAVFKVASASDTAPYEVVPPFVPDLNFTVIKEVVEGDGSSVVKTEWLVGDTIWFKVTITNEGNVPIDSFEYEDLLISDILVDVDETIGFEGSYSFWISYPDAGLDDDENVIDVTGYNDLYELDFEAGDEVAFTVEEPDIEEPPVEWVESFMVEKRVVVSQSDPSDKTSWYDDQVITFEFTVTNTGNVPMDGFYFSDAMLEVEDEFIDVALSGYDPLSDDDMYVFYRTYGPGEIGEFTNVVVVDGEYYEGQVSITETGDVDFSVSDRPSTPPPSVVYYTVSAVSDPAGVADFTGTGGGFTFGSSYDVNYINVSDGYTFIGWNLEPSGTISGNVNLIASFELIEDEEIPEDVPKQPENTPVDEPEIIIPVEEIPEEIPVVELIEEVVDEFPDEEIAEVILDEEIAEEFPDEELPEAGGIPLAVNMVVGGLVAGIGGALRKKRR